MPRGAAAEQRALPAREHRGQVPGFEARRSMSDAVDAAVLPQQPALPYPSLDPGSGHARVKQLRSA